MNLEVFREQDTVWIRDTDTDDEWPLPAEVWDGVHQPIIDQWEDPTKVEHLPEGVFDARDPDEIETQVAVAVTVDYFARILALPPVWGPVSVEPTGASAGDNPDRRG